MSWQQLLSIRESARQDRLDELSRPPQACPNDGEPLLSGPDGVLFCKWDGWQYPRDDSRPIA